MDTTYFAGPSAFSLHKLLSPDRVVEFHPKTHSHVEPLTHRKKFAPNLYGTYAENVSALYLIQQSRKIQSIN